MVMVMALFFGVLFAASALAVAALSRILGVRPHHGVVPAAALLGLGLLVVLAVLIRAIRMTAAPLGEVMEAADRVAEGDYSARVEERGPRDVRRLVRSFNEMTQRLRANEDQRRNLLADVAHELRTPLSVIQGTAEGILDGLYPADRAHVEPMLEEAKVMARLLDDLQTLSTAEAGVLRLHREAAEPHQLVADAVAAIRTAADAAHVGLEERVAPDLPAMDVDPVRIGEVLGNLLHNAVRHTPAGGAVTVSAELAGPGRVAFEVRDTGRGIDPELLPHVFDRFVKSSDTGGAGLGLAIARGLVLAHRGDISAESEPGHGTTMRFVIPVSPPLSTP
jgi:signal transduction histidine kinase